MRIGIDWGGTKIEAIALSDAGMVLARKRIATPQHDYEACYEPCIAAAAGLVREIETTLGQTGTVNGPAWKALIEEEFGDGIMSAIDFDFDLERLAHEKGDRVKITMSGKFLPYKYYGAEQGLPQYGFKEE